MGLFLRGVLLGVATFALFGCNESGKGSVEDKEANSAASPRPALPVASPVAMAAKGTPIPQANLAEELFPLPADTALPSTSTLDVAGGGKGATVLYMAPVHDPDGVTSSPAATLFEELLRYSLRAAPPSGLVLNPVPAFAVRVPYTRSSGTGQLHGKGVEAYAADARQLGCDVFVFATCRETNGNVEAALTLRDLRSSQTESWSKSLPLENLSSLLGEASVKVALFSGANDQAVKEAGLAQSQAGPVTWRFMLRNVVPPLAEYRAAMAQEPESGYLKEAAITHAGGEYLVVANEILKAAPKDNRLLLAKAEALMNHDKPMSGLVIFAELLRRHPSSLILAHQASRFLHAAYYDEKNCSAKTAPAPYGAIIGDLGMLHTRYPDNWALSWDLAVCHHNFARLVRGAETVDKIPDANMEESERAFVSAAQLIKLAVQRQPDCPYLLQDVINYYDSAGGSSWQLQQPMLEKVRKLDPGNVDAEIIIMSSHSAGWDDNESLYLRLANEALTRHQGDGKALTKLAGALGTELSRRTSFNRWTAKDAMSRNQFTDVFQKAAEQAIGLGGKLDDYDAKALFLLYHNSGETTKALAFAGSGSWPHTAAEAANIAYGANETSLALTLARKGLDTTTTEDWQDSLQFMAARILYKAGRKDEAIKECDAGMKKFPGRYYFPYLKAVMLADQKDRQEEALKLAERASAQDPTNPAARDLVAKLRKKLNKP
ncbi:MAG: hypothetical protein K1X53_03600 [Candidatus Sumerlaeaceae bacterium]|nr:hypothetical protein [Candidatus Sumerlaeaceae bacterium]